MSNATGEHRIIEVGGPYFDDLHLGQTFDDAPAVTITDGYATMHQALFADRSRLPLDHELSRQVTGCAEPVVNASLVCNVAIGQTTAASQRVKGNLFYRGLVLKRPVHIGDTLHTVTRVVGLKQNRIKPGRAATGMAALEMKVRNQRDETVMQFYRCPMIPCRDPDADTGHADRFDAIPAELAPDSLRAAVPTGWRLDRFRELVRGAHFGQLEVGSRYIVQGRDTVTCAPELVRMTLNLAITHADARASAYGKRLVYGGHTISMAAALLTRALPNLVTTVAWRSCDHTAPVFEEDILRAEITVDATHSLDRCGGLVDLHTEVFAERGPQAPEAGENIRVLDWHLVGLFA